jgi:predicted MPP superfamily phosphohydrolase
LSKFSWLKGVAVAGGSAALAGIGALAYARYVEPARIDVTPVTFALRRLTREFDGYRIVQLSDIHVDGVMTRERLAHVVALANAQNPDLVVVTGDFVSQGVAFNADDLVVPLCELRARDAKVAVMGNHDQREHTLMVHRILDESGMINLNNAVHTVRRGKAHLQIAGVDSMYRQRARLDLVMNQLPDDGAAILLAHEPDFADVGAATGRFDLQLSGHSHGGQVRLPLLLRLGLPHYGDRYVIGLHLVGEMLLYVNRGLGMTSMPIRFNCRPEIAVITLRAALEA